MATLSKEEKAQIITSHLRSLAYTRYGLEIDTVQENAKSSPNSGVLSNINSQMEDIDAQVAALNAELAAVNALTE